MSNFPAHHLIIVPVALILMLSTGDKPEALESASEAVERSLELCGNPQSMTGGQPNAVLVRPTADSTPFVHRLIVGRSVWKVRFSNAAIPFKGLSDSLITIHRRDFEVLIDSATGNLLKIVSTKIESGETPIPISDALTAEKRFQRSTVKFEGLPEGAIYPFFKVLSIIPFGPYRAQNIEAYCIDVTTRYHAEPRTRWFVVLRGIPAIITHSDLDTGRKVNVLVSADGVTGEVISVTPAP